MQFVRTIPRENYSGSVQQSRLLRSHTCAHPGTSMALSRKSFMVVCCYRGIIVWACMMRYCCEKANLTITKKLTDWRPTDLPRTFLNTCHAIWFMRQYIHGRENIGDADVLVHIWRQAICNHRDDVAQSAYNGEWPAQCWTVPLDLREISRHLRSFAVIISIEFNSSTPSNTYLRQ